MDTPFAPIRVLYIGPDEKTARAVAAQLREQSSAFEVSTVHSVTAALEYLESGFADCVVAAFDLGGRDGITLLERLQERDISLPFILFPDTSNDEIASRAVTAGVDRYRPNTTIEASIEDLAVDIVDVLEEHSPESELLDRMTDAFFALDDEWRFTYLNDLGQEIICEAIGTELTIEELRGRRIWAEIPEAEGTTFHEKYTEAMETQEPVTFEEYYEPLDRWFEVRAFPSLTGLSVYLYDVTDRRNYETELERREAVLQDIYRIIADKDRSFKQKVEELLRIGRNEIGMAYGSLSRIDGENYTLDVVVGPDHERIDEGETIPLSGMNCEVVFNESDRLALANIERDAPELTDRMVYSELGLKSYVGAPVFVEDAVDGTFCLYDSDSHGGGFSDWEMTLIDLMASWVSYERERETQRRELERERNRLDDVASTLSHDLRNPLTTANLRLDLASEECNSEHLEDVETALDRIDELVGDVLTMARLGKQVIDPEPVSLQTLVTEAWQTAGAADATLQVEDDVLVVCDESRLRQLCENLFRNAVEHGSTGNRPAADDAVEHSSTSPDSQARQDAVEHGSTSPDSQARQDAVEHATSDHQPTAELQVTVGALEDGFCVADNGPGIPAAKREEIFDRGYSTQQDGTGFGLAIAEEVIEAHGATISVTDSEDGGARFEIHGLEIR